MGKEYIYQIQFIGGRRSEKGKNWLNLFTHEMLIEMALIKLQFLQLKLIDTMVR